LGGVYVGWENPDIVGCNAGVVGVNVERCCAGGEGNEKDGDVVAVGPKAVVDPNRDGRGWNVDFCGEDGKEVVWKELVLAAGTAGGVWIGGA
jgi:hypothetical protein